MMVRWLASDTWQVDYLQTIKQFYAAVAPATTNLSSAKLAFESRWLSLARWYDKLIIDLDEDVEVKLQTLRMGIGLFIFLDIVALWLIFYLFRRNVLEPLKQI
jgi:nitrate/nitrite-specific signal transduction histidine kinase